MLGLAIVLLIINIFLMLFIFLKLSKKYSNVNIIADIRKDAERLVTDIAFQTEKSVTVIEDKIKEAKRIKEELEKTIILADREEVKKSRQEKILNELKTKEPVKSETTVKENAILKNKELVAEDEILKTENTDKGNKIIGNEKTVVKNTNLKNEKPIAANEPIQIYTKQILSSSNKKTLVPEASFNEQIIEMSKKGFSVELIAEKVPLPIGEIELIISMNG